MALRLLTKCISRIMALLFLYGKPYFKIEIIVINFRTRIDFNAHPACWLIFTGREKFCINPPIQVLECLWHFPSTREHRPSICRHFLNRQPCRYITARISRSNCIVKIPPPLSGCQSICQQFPFEDIFWIDVSAQRVNRSICSASRSCCVDILLADFLSSSVSGSFGNDLKFFPFFNSVIHYRSSVTIV